MKSLVPGCASECPLWALSASDVATNVRSVCTELGLKTIRTVIPHRWHALQRRGSWWTLAIYMQPSGRDIAGDGISRLTSSSHDRMYLCASLFEIFLTHQLVQGLGSPNLCASICSPWDGGCVALMGIMRAYDDYDDFLPLIYSSATFIMIFS